MRITSTHFNDYWLCHRKLWLFANGLTMEQDSNLVCEGKMLHQYSYPQRTSKYQEVAIEGIKVDYYDANSKVIHEIKKSNKCDTAHEWQLKYYIYIFERNGITGVKGILEYPLLRKTTEVLLSNVDREDIQAIETNKLLELKMQMKSIIQEDKDSVIVFTNKFGYSMNKQVIGKERMTTDNFL